MRSTKVPAECRLWSISWASQFALKLYVARLTINTISMSTETIVLDEPRIGLLPRLNEEAFRYTAHSFAIILKTAIPIVGVLALGLIIAGPR